jgi:hypothetical protein
MFSGGGVVRIDDAEERPNMVVVSAVLDLDGGGGNGGSVDGINFGRPLSSDLLVLTSC